MFVLLQVMDDFEDIESRKQNRRRNLKKAWANHESMTRNTVTMLRIR